MRRFGSSMALACAGLLTLTACGSDPVTDASQNVAFTSCSQTECAGTLPSGAEFEILMPEDWSGSLAIFSHGLRGMGAPQSETENSVGDQVPTPTSTAEPDEPTPGESGSAAADDSGKSQKPDSSKPDSSKSSSSKSESADKSGKKGDGSAKPKDVEEPSPTPTLPQPRPGGPEPAPLWGAGDKAIADVMLQANYAVAGATPPGQGWSVGAQITADEELYEYFTQNVATPNRVYSWGESTGGLASVRLAELHPDWVSGAVAMCAPMSGPNPSFDLALDVGFAVQQLLYRDMKLVNFESEADALAVRQKAVGLVQSAATAEGAEGQARVLFIAALASLPTQTRTESGTTLDSQVRASVEGITNLLNQSTVQRYRLEVLVGGNPSGNFGSDYRLRLTPEQREGINGVFPEATSKFYTELLRGDRISPDIEAQRAVAAQGELVGNLEVPVMTLHNVFDPVYIAENESWYRERAAANGPEAAANLVNAFVIPQQFYDDEAPAGEGAGNCNFEPATIIGVLIQLNDWVRYGNYPGRDSLSKAFKGAQVTIEYDPGPWPAMALSPLDPPLILNDSEIEPAQPQNPDSNSPSTKVDPSESSPSR